VSYATAAYTSTETLLTHAFDIQLDIHT